MLVAFDWNHALHRLDAALAPFWLLPLLVAVGLWLVGMAGVVRFGSSWEASGRVRWGLFAVGFAGFTAVVGSGIGIVELEQAAVSGEIAPRLNAQILTVQVDGRPCRSARTLVEALRSRTDDHPDHSSASDVRHDVLLQSTAGPLRLAIARDDKDPRNWWVFYDGFHLTTMNDIGHALTDAPDHC